MKEREEYKTNNDVEVYNKLIILINTNSKWLRNTLPSFIIEESLEYFICNEDYDKCMVLRDFIDLNPGRVGEMSRKEWFDSI